MLCPSLRTLPSFVMPDIPRPPLRSLLWILLLSQLSCNLGAAQRVCPVFYSHPIHSSIEVLFLSLTRGTIFMLVTLKPILSQDLTILGPQLFTGCLHVNEHQEL